MQSDFNSAAPTPSPEQMGRELLDEMLKTDTGGDCDYAKCLRLIAAGASLTELTITADDFSRETALHLALRQTRDNPRANDIARAMIDASADLEIKDGSGNTPLMTATVYGNLKLAEELVDRGVKLEATNGMAYTALLWAGYWGKNDIAAMLIRRGANADFKDPQGHTAADWARLNVDSGFSNSGTAEAIATTAQEVADERERFETWRDKKGMPLEKPLRVSRPLVLRTR